MAFRFYLPTDKRPVATLTLLFALIGCASDPEMAGPNASVPDKLEPFNRAMLQLDQGLDTVIFIPVGSVYETVIPAPGRQGITNALANLRSPITLANDLLQGEVDRAGTTTGRFVVNSTVGVFGLFDVASRMGMERHGEDFGQTLAVWGVSEGTYLYLPVLGPTTTRDFSGYAVDTLTFDPMAWVTRADNPYWWGATYAGTFIVDTKVNARPALEELKESSIDYYAALRSAYLQNRQRQILNGAPAPFPQMDEEGEDPFAANTNARNDQTAAYGEAP